MKHVARLLVFYSGRQMIKHVTVIGYGLIGKELEKQLKERQISYNIIERVCAQDKEILRKDTTDVIVTAQYNQSSQSFSEDLFFVNVTLYKKVFLEARAKNIKRIAVFSSGSVYGKGCEEPFNEERLIDISNLSPYALSKVAMETVAQSFRDDFETLSIFRPFLMYGRGTKLPRLLARIPDMLRNGECFTLAKGIGIVQNPIHVSDAARITLDSLNHKGCEVFNLCGDEIISLKEMIWLTAEHMEIVPNIEKTEADVFYSCGTSDKLKRFNHIPNVKFKNGLIDFLDNMPVDKN